MKKLTMKCTKSPNKKYNRYNWVKNVMGILL